MRERIRVAHLIQNLNYGGMERVLHELAKGLPGRGFEVHIVVLEYYGRFAIGLDNQASLHRVGSMSRLSLLWPGPLVQLLQQIGPDVVHSHSGIWFKAARAAHLAGVPAVVHTEHGRPVPDRFIGRLLDRQASRWTDAVIAVSEPLAAFLRSQVVQDPSRVQVIANGVRTEPAVVSDPEVVRRGLGLPAGAPVIGSVGRLEPVKNYGLALRALARLTDGWNPGPPPFLILVGDGSERAALEALAEHLGIGSQVRFLGWRDDAERLYPAFDLFTLSSRSEGTSISLLEAMNSRVCPVVTDVGGNRGVLGQELAALLVPPGDETALAAAWRQYLLNPELRYSLARRAQERARGCFSLRQMIDRHAQLYRTLVDRKRTAGRLT